MAKSLIVAEEQVRGLDVAVDQTLAVRVVEASGGLEPDHQRLGQREGSAVIEHRSETSAAEEFTHEVGHAVVGARVVDVHDVRMVQGRSRMSLSAEPLDEGGVTRHGLVEHLEGHPAPELGVVSQTDAGRGTRAQRRDDPIPVGHDATDQLAHLGQRPRLKCYKRT